uniref:Uncharacterized protein n=1 Tax=Panagrolaimus sp. PS1159 TaxID=55785 RepID=A0AC35GNW3_9BILA
METEKEIYLTNQNHQLKKRIKEMEALFGEIDDQYQASLKELMDEKKELTAKNTALESRLLTVSEEKAELTELVENYKGLAEKNRHEQPTSSQSNFMSESFVTEFADLQDQVDKLNEDKIALQSRIRQLENDIGNMVQEIESLERTNAELEKALTSVDKEKKQLAKENKRMAECVTSMQMQIDQIDMLSVTQSVDRKEHGHSLFGEIEAAREEYLQKKAEMEQEITVLRKTLSSRGEDDRRRAKDFECMRDSAKTLSEKNKELRKELELRKDAEAESIAIKQAASQIEKENELLKAEVARLK